MDSIHPSDGPLDYRLVAGSSRSSPTPGLVTLHGRTLDDIAGIRSLMQKVYPPPHGPEAVWSETFLLQHLAHFPDGQIVASDSQGSIIGTSTTMRLPLETAIVPHSWPEITGEGTLRTHVSDGNVLYGVNIAVDPDWQGQGVGRLLYDARLDLARRLGCSAFVAGARIPGYHLHAHAMSPEAYVDAVVQGAICDPTLSKQIRIGFEVRGVLRDYARDHETLGHAALIYLKL